MRRTFMTFALAVGLLGYLPAFAEKDSRKPLDTNQFEAIGQLYVLINPNIKYSAFSITDKEIKAKADEAAKLGHDFQYNFCSATLVSSNFILTAAHCALTFHHFQRAQLTVYFQSANKKYKPQPISYIYKSGGLADENFVNDWALLKPKEPITTIYPIKMITLSKKEKEEAQLLSAGFPWRASGKLLAGSSLLGTHCHFLKSDQIKNLSPKAISRMVGADISNCQASAGNSGGPLMIQKTDGVEVIYYVVGVIAVVQQESSFLASAFGLKADYHLFSVPTQTIWDNLR